MAIEAVEARRYRIPLEAPLTDAAHGAMTAFDLILVEVRAARGSGTGYTYTVGQGSSAILALVRDDLAPLLVGEDEDRVEALWVKMWRALHYVGRGAPASFAMAAVDVALWDLKAKAAGLPLWRLLGGHDPRVRAYAGGIDLHDPLDDLLARTGKRLAEGFRAIKMKVGRAFLHEDVERVRRMRELLGEGFPLMADANMGWSTGEAVAAARALAPFGLVWLEEPVTPDDFAAHRRVRDHGGVPLAAGENLHTLAEFAQLVNTGGVDFPEPDLATCGGVTPWRKVAALAEANGLPVTSHGVHDLHVHLLAAVPNASFLEVHGFGLDAFLERPLEMRDGFAIAPERPGHGVAFDVGSLQGLGG